MGITTETSIATPAARSASPLTATSGLCTITVLPRPGGAPGPRPADLLADPNDQVEGGAPQDIKHLSWTTRSSSTGRPWSRQCPTPGASRNTPNSPLKTQPGLPQPQH